MSLVVPETAYRLIDALVYSAYPFIAIALTFGLIRFLTDRSIYRMFGLSPKQYRLVAHDLGVLKRKKVLKVDGLAGVPDAIFVHRREQSMVVGEFKSRRNRYPNPSKYERYQVILYIGMLKKMNRHIDQVRGIVAYGNGRRFNVPDDPRTYDWLLSLREEAALAGKT